MSWRRFFRRRRLDSQIAGDVEFYIEAETDDNIARGLTPAEARAAALRKFGNRTIVREEVYRMNTVAFLESIWQDLRYAWRGILQNPGFAATAVLTLALGIGGNTAIFTVVRSVILKPLDYPNAERLVKVAEFDPDTTVPITIDFTTAWDLRAATRTFASLSLYRDASGAIVGQDATDLLNGKRVNYDYFRTLGVHMQIGRDFLAEEDHPNTRREVILTHGVWTRRFGGNPNIVGTDIPLSGNDFRVVGVLPASFRAFADDPEIYLPLGYELGQPFACRGCQHLQAIGRLKPGVTVERAQSELSAVMRNIVATHPEDYAKGAAITVEPLQHFIVGGVSKAMWVLLGGVGFVLLIACANVANLVLARATRRTREMALRTALGAARSRIVRQLLAEYLLLAAAGGAAGLLLAWRGTAALSAFAAQQIPRAGEIQMDGMVLAFTLITTLLTVLLFGAAPAIRASRADCSTALQEMGRTTEGRSHQKLRNALVAAELALAFVLVMGAGLLGRSFLHLTEVNPGYDPRNVLTAGVYVYGTRYQKPEVELEFYHQALARLRAAPGVESAAMVSTLPLNGFDRRSFQIQDRRPANEHDVPAADTYCVSPDYFHVLHIPIKRGRGFTGQDRKGAPLVAIVSEACARSQFPGRDAIGQHIQLGGRHDDRPWAEIVGIVGDIRQYSLDRPPNMEAYIPQAQNMDYGFNLVVRTTLDPVKLENTVRAAFRAVDQTQPLYNVRPLETYVADSMATRAFTLALLALFGALAILLAAVGIYGVISYSVTLRTREVGIRMAMGAASGDVLGMVLRQSLRLIGIGLAAGFVASLGVTRFLGSLLFEVRPTDLATSAGVAAVLAAIALIASYLPALRATRIDPVAALRAG